MKTLMPIILFTLAALLLPSVSSATTVEAVTFEQLVHGAERIFVGEVVAVESFRADLRGHRRIRTRVTFSVDQPLRGRGVMAVLEFLGGTVGELTQEVAGMPVFIVGEPYVVFAREGDHWINPVVGFSQGLFRVSPDVRSGALRVLTAGRAPLVQVAAIGRPLRASSELQIPMSLPVFVDRIRAEMARQGR